MIFQTGDMCFVLDFDAILVSRVRVSESGRLSLGTNNSASVSRVCSVTGGSSNSSSSRREQ